MLLQVLQITNPQKKISIEKTFGGLKFAQNGKNLIINKLVSTIKNNQNSYKLIKSANSNNLLAQVI